MKRSEMNQEQKKRQNRQAAKSREEYNSKTYDKVTFRIRRDGADGLTADQLRAAADANGQSLNAWLLDAIKDKL